MDDDDRTTLKSTLTPGRRDHLALEASNPVPGSIYLALDARWHSIHVDANELRAAIDKAVGPADSPEPQPVKITDEMVERGRAAYWGETYGASVDLRVRAILTAALTEPPARPEGAEELDPIVDEFLTSYWRGDIDGPDATDWLAARGVRVVGEEDPQ